MAWNQLRSSICSYTDGSASSAGDLDTGRADGYRSCMGIVKFASNDGPSACAIFPVSPVGLPHRGCKHHPMGRAFSRHYRFIMPAAALASFKSQILEICTDRLSSMYMTHNYMRCPLSSLVPTGAHWAFKHWCPLLPTVPTGLLSSASRDVMSLSQKLENFLRSPRRKGEGR